MLHRSRSRSRRKSRNVPVWALIAAGVVVCFSIAAVVVLLISSAIAALFAGGPL